MHEENFKHLKHKQKASQVTFNQIFPQRKASKLTFNQIFLKAKKHLITFIQTNIYLRASKKPNIKHLEQKLLVTS